MNIATTGIVKGSLSLNVERRRWVIEAEHDVMRLLKRMFERIPASAVGQVELADNARARAELYWVLARWRFDVSAEDAARVEQGMLEEHAREEHIASILAPEYVPRRIDLALPLRPYQRLVADIVLEQGFLLSADEMGLGKTAEAIGMLSDPRARPAMVVCPTPLPWQWKAQIDKFLPGLRMHIARQGKVPDLTVGPKGERVPVPDVVILSYSKLAKWAPYLATFCQSAVYDEAQAFRHEWTNPKKERRTNIYEAGLYLRDRLKFRFALTGTPIFNRGGEIRNVLNILVEDAVGNDKEFATEFCGGATGTKALVLDPSALGVHLRDRLLMIRHTREQVGIQLPKCTRNVQIIDSDPKALDAIKTSAVEFAKLLLQRGLAGEDKRDAGRELDWRLRQATGIAKAPFVAEIVKMLLEAGEPKVLVFAWHKAVYKILASALWDYKPVFYTGAESDVQKRASADAFIRGKSRVLIMSNRAGVGIDGLQEVCSCGIIAELDYSPKQHDQNVTRLDRPGQTKPVMIHILMTNDGSDPVIADMLGIKQEQSDKVLDPGSNPFELGEIHEDKMRLLATDYLSRHAPHVLEAIMADNKALEEAKETEKRVREEAKKERQARPKQGRRRPPVAVQEAAEDAGSKASVAPSLPVTIAAPCPAATPSIGTAIAPPPSRFTATLHRGSSTR
jgi:hypothetical protein